MKRLINWLKWFFEEDRLIDESTISRRIEEKEEEPEGIRIVMNRSMGYFSFKPSKGNGSNSTKHRA